MASPCYSFVKRSTLLASASERWSPEVRDNLVSLLEEARRNELWRKKDDARTVCELLGNAATQHPGAVVQFLSAGGPLIALQSLAHFGAECKEVAAAGLVALASLWAHAPLQTQGAGDGREIVIVEEAIKLNIIGVIVCCMQKHRAWSEAEKLLKVCIDQIIVVPSKHP